MNSTTTNNELFAFRVEIDDKTCITFAKTPQAARFNAVNSMREAGYLGQREWPMSVKAHRVPRYDNSHLKSCAKRACYSEEHV